VYEGPVDCVAVATDVRLAFVKNYYGLASSHRSYRYVGSFGVDVWNVSTGTCRPVLPFDKYGRLLQLAVSPDASAMALLLVNAATSCYVIVFDVDYRRGATAAGRRRPASLDFVVDDDGGGHGAPDVRCVAPHEGCSAFVVAPDWDFMATASTTGQKHGGQSDDVRLWDLDSGDAVVHFQVSFHSKNRQKMLDLRTHDMSEIFDLGDAHTGSLKYFLFLYISIVLICCLSPSMV